MPMQTNFVFKTATFRCPTCLAANSGYRYFRHELENASRLTLTEIDKLLLLKKFPQPRFREPWGWSWNATKITAYRWGLVHSKKHASNIEKALGYRRDDWAT